MTDFAGAGTLARLIVRRDRLRLPLWIYAIAGLPLLSAVSLRGLYPTVVERLAFGDTIRANGSFRALDGQVYDASSVGGLTAWRALGISATLAALMSVLTVVRHTRAEEESGRTELVAAGVVGRNAALSATLLVVAGVNGIAGLVIALGMIGLGTPVAGSIAFGVAVTLAGLAFAAVAAVAAQIPDSSRAANGIGCAALAFAFLLRAAGDGGGDADHTGWSAWLSPIGWAQQVRPYAQERWWLFALSLAFIAVLVSAAYALVARRDVGSGLRAARLGPADAVPSLRSPLALAWRQQRGSLIGWSIGFLVVGVALGASAGGVGSLLESSSQIKDVVDKLGSSGGPASGYLSVVFGICGIVAAAYCVQAALRLRSEETGMRAEPLLATTVTRFRWMASHLVLALVGTAVVLVAAGFGAGVARGIATGDAGELPRLIGAALGQWPAAAVLGGAAAAVFGLWPRATTLAWGLVALAAVLTLFGPLLRLGQPILDVSPFTHTPKLPGDVAAPLPIVALVVVAGVLAAVGFGAFQRRDVG
jgi:ABC-2 type transport system permease protein